MTRRWSIAGAAAGVMMTACMLVLQALSGAQTLPELFQDQVIALVPGPVFSFVLDRLQFAAKPLLLVGLSSLAVPAGVGLGWVYGRAWPRSSWLGRDSVGGGIGYGLLLWAALELVVAALGDGVTAAIASAGLLLASTETYGISLVGLVRLVESPITETTVDRRRRALVFSGLTGGALVLAGGGLARRVVLNTEQATVELARPEAVSIPSGVSEEITSNERFYVVSKNFNDPRVNADRWSLEVSGLVDETRQFTYAEILDLPTVSQYTTLACISNTVGGKLLSNAYWTGFRLSQLLGKLGRQANASSVVFRSTDNYYESFPLDIVLADDVLLAHTMNGAPLPDKHGFPLRLILPGRYGMKNPKWIVKIELVADRIDGYWVRRGWDREALVQTVARIDNPTDGASIAGPRVEVGGVAFASSRGISRVEASLDGGSTWRGARIRPPLGPSAWVQWGVGWEDLSPGAYTVLARASDGSGALQTADEHDPFPRGATGYHHASIDVRG